jgi:hypothetical protein
VLSQAERDTVEQYLSRKYNIPFPTSYSSARINSNGVQPFGSTGLSINFSGISTVGTATVQRFNSPAQNVSFSGTPPINVSQYRYEITRVGLTFSQAELRFNRTQIPNSGITSPQTVTVYGRPNSGLGAFSALTNTYNASFPDEVRATAFGFGEFIFGSSDNQLSLIQLNEGKPKQYALLQNYPNPFNPTTTISYQLPVASQVSLKVFDVLGREVMTLVNGRQDAGAYNFNFNASDLSSGVYFYRLQSGNFVQTKKMMLVK